MILATSSARRDAFQSEYLDKYLRDSREGKLASLAATLSDPRFPGALLPRRIASGTIFYAVCDGQREWRSLSAYLKAFVGLTVTDFAGLTTPLDDNDEFEKWLAAQDFGAVARFRPGSGLDNAALQALLRLQTGLARSGAALRQVPRTTAQLLRDFDLALSTGDSDQANSALAELKDGSRLDARNVRFLEVQKACAFREWDTLVESPLFNTVCAERRPLRVTTALLEALYHARVAKSRDESAGLETFRRSILLRYNALFEVCPTSPSAAVATMFLLQAICEGKTADIEPKLRFAEAAWTEEQRQAFEAWRTLVPASSVAEPPTWMALQQACERQAETEGPATLDGARSLLFWAATQDTLESARRAIGFVDRLSPADKATLLAAPTFRHFWEQINAGSAPRDWAEWVKRLPSLGFDEVRELTRRAIMEWPIASSLRTTPDVARLLDTIADLDDEGKKRLAMALPELLEWFGNDPSWPNPVYGELYATVLGSLLPACPLEKQGLLGLTQLYDAALSARLSPPSYNGLMAAVVVMVRRLEGTEYLEWAVDAAELAMLHECTHASSRRGLYDAVMTAIEALPCSVGGVLEVVLTEIGPTLGLPERPLQRPTPSHALDGVRVAVYTSNQGVGDRVCRLLGAWYPGLLAVAVTSEVPDAIANNDTLVFLALRSGAPLVSDSSTRVKQLAARGTASLLISILPMLRTRPTGNQPSWGLLGTLIEDIETILGRYVMQRLREQFGDNYFLDGIPHDMKVECFNRQQRERSTAPLEAFLDLIDFRKILSNHWTLFEQDMTIVSNLRPNVSKDLRTEWIHFVNEIRKTWAHPTRRQGRPPTEKEIDTLQTYHERVQRTLNER